MKSREFKDSVFQHFAMIAQAFSSPKRLEIIDVLAQGERVDESSAKEVPDFCGGSLISFEGENKLCLKN